LKESEAISSSHPRPRPNTPLLFWPHSPAGTVPETSRRTKLSLYCLFTFHYASVRMHLIEYDIKTLQYEQFYTIL
jgi:hypothetical protein